MFANRTMVGLTRHKRLHVHLQGMRINERHNGQHDIRTAAVLPAWDSGCGGGGRVIGGRTESRSVRSMGGSGHLNRFSALAGGPLRRDREADCLITPIRSAKVLTPDRWKTFSTWKSWARLESAIRFLFV